jgi:ribosomal protein S18 acetylase RimI-like enzyme
MRDLAGLWGVQRTRVGDCDLMAKPRLSIVDSAMEQLALARRAHLNMVEAFASLAGQQAGGFLRRAGGVVVAATGSPIALFNEVLPVGDDVEAGALVEAVAAVQSAGMAFLVQLRGGVDDGLLSAVHELGLEEDPDVSWPAMILTEMPTAAVGPERLRIVRVASQADFDEFVRSGVRLDLYPTWLSRAILDDPRWALFLGYEDGVPVARSMSFRADDVVGVYNVGTAEHARRRGYGWAITLAAIRAGAIAGCTLATLQSSAMARSIYEAHAFRALYRYRAFRGA